MVWAVHWSTGEWKEHTKYGKFQATFSSSLGNTNLSNIAGKIALTVGGQEGSTLSCLQKEWDAFKLDSCYDSVTQEMVFQTTMPDNSWFSIGFGNSMTNTDMITWFASDGSGSALDYFSESHSAPELDSVQNLALDGRPVFDQASKTMTFITRRKLDTGDSG